MMNDSAGIEKDMVNVLFARHHRRHGCESGQSRSVPHHISMHLILATCS